MSEILVVDDKPEVRKSFTRLLESEGYSVRCAVNGDKALDAIYVRKPDLVLLDIDMPRRNGFSTCEEIRRFDQLLPVIFLTGFDSDVNELRARGMGADDFFSKTADVTIILATIRRTLARVKAFENKNSVDGFRIQLGAVVVDMCTFDVIADGCKYARLTKTEADILRILAEDRDRNYSAELLVSRLRGEGFVCEDAMLYVHMYNLRKKLGVASEFIVSVRGEGYHLKR